MKKLITAFLLTLLIPLAADAAETYSGDKREGLYLWWHDNGKLSSSTIFVDGKPEGLSQEWYDNGQLRYEGTYVDGEAEGSARWWYSNGQLNLKTTFVENKLNGWHLWWHPNGQQFRRDCYRAGELIDGTCCKQQQGKVMTTLKSVAIRLGVIC